MARRRRAARTLTQVIDPATGEPLPWFSRERTQLAITSDRLGLPAEIRVLGQSYRVIVIGNLFNDRHGRVGLDGGCSFAHRIIVIEAGLPRAKALYTLGHEIAHVYVAANRALRDLAHRHVEAVCDLIADVLEDRR